MGKSNFSPYRITILIFELIQKTLQDFNIKEQNNAI
jgi:hypothetical protein